MATLEELQNRVQSTLSLTVTGNELDLLTGYLNEGYVDVLTRTRCRVNCGDLTTIADVWKYRLPAAILAVNEMWVEATDSTTAPTLQRVASSEIIRLRRGQASINDGTPSAFAIEGHDMLLLWPTPTVAGEIEYLYCPRPTDMVDDDDRPSYVPAEWHKAIEMYAAWRMADYDDDGSSQVGELYRVHYEGPDGRGGMLRDIRQQNRVQGGRRLGTARVGRRGMRARASRSVDV